MTKNLRLHIGAITHFIIAAGHAICLFALDKAFDAYGIRETMTKMVMGHTWMLYAITVALTFAFAIAGVYAYSAMGKIKRLPLTRVVCIAIVAVYGLRAIIGLASCAMHFAWLPFVSSAIPAFLAYCYWPGTKKMK